MKKKFRVLILILLISIFIPALSGCNGGSKPSSSKKVSATASSKSGANSAGFNKLSPGLWKMKIRTTVHMPAVMGRPAVNHSAVTTMTECIKHGSSKAKPYTEPANFKCSEIKEHTDMDGTIHWSMKCSGPKMSMSSKGVSKITQDSFRSHAKSTTVMANPGFSMKTTATVDTSGKRISSKCPSKS